MRVIRNNDSGIDGNMYIGYGNRAGGLTYIFGGGSTGGAFTKYSSYSQEEGSFRAPLFYDSNNTGYYTDPASTSNLNALTVNGNLNAYGGILSVNRINFTTTSGSQASDPYCMRWIDESSARGNGLSWLEFQLNDDSNEEIRIYGNSCVGYGCGAISDNLYHRFRTDGYAYNSGIHEAGASHRSPIYYDSNNTGYYTDPASTSNLNSVSMQGGNVYGVMYFHANRNTTSDSPPLQAYSSNGSGAIMSFHRGGYYAVNFGLDSDNVIRIGGWSAAANRWQLDMSGNMTAAGNVTAYSDIRLKDNIELIENALEKVTQLNGVTFTRNDQEDKTRRHTGVIAQEVEKVLPEVVSEDNQGIKNVAYGNMMGLMIEAIKELKGEIEELKSKIPV
jgi:hypothetical protein